MQSKYRLIAACLLPCLFLVSCGESSEKSEQELKVSGARSAITFLHVLSAQDALQSRPSASLGIFSGIFASQGLFLPVRTAIIGFEVQKLLLEKQSIGTSDENFAILSEIGAILQFDIVEGLNRSTDRAKTLEEYIQSLRNAGILIERKVNELEELENIQKAETREKRTVARDIERELKSVLKEKNYGDAATLEKQLQEAKSEHIEIATKYEQTKDMKERFSKLYEITAIRLQAVENNREILIAGLQVIQVPGIDDIGILQEGKKWRKKRSSEIFSNPR